MRKNLPARVIAFALALVFLFPTGVSARVDRFILTDPVRNTYTGRPNTLPMISGLAFTDMPPSGDARDAIVRSGALGSFMPQGGAFRPNAPVTRGEAIAYIVRAAGFSDEARERVATTAPTLPEGSNLALAVTFSYMVQAREMGMLTAAEYNDALAALEQPALGALFPGLPGQPQENVPAPIPFHAAPATREEIAYWVYQAFDYALSGIWERPVHQPGPSIYVYTDRNNISPERYAAVSAMVRNGVMVSTAGTTIFNPQGTLPRIFMASLIRNLDTMHFEVLGLERHTGTVAEIQQEQFVDTLTGQSWHNVFIRRADGGVDVLRSTQRVSPSPQDGPLDVVVLRNGMVMGLAGLQIGDQIEYITHPESDTIWYVRVLGELAMQNFVGRLQRVNIEDGTMTFTDPNGRSVTFPMIYGMYGLNNDGVPFVRFGHISRAVDTMPLGSFYTVTLINNVVSDIEFLGDPVLYMEIRGVVVENNPQMGFITIIDESRRERTFNYIPNTLRVQRRDFYDMREAGWNMTQLLQDISEIIPGDIVSFRTATDDPLRITHISAAAQTTTRYGRILEFRPMGGSYEMLMEFPNGQTGWFTVVNGILVLEHGRPVPANRIQVGDWAQIRVNQALLGPGVMMESVLEVALDGGGHHINTIVMGQLSRFTPAQNQLQIANATELTPEGWRNHQPLAMYNIGGSNVRYFFDGREVTLSFLNRYLQRGSGTVYIAMENNFAGERIAMVSVRSGRDELLQPESVLSAAAGTFNLLGISGNIETDAGTIVVRNGRLVDPTQIQADDWARVALNGHNTAAVVDISQAPSHEGVQIVRGRVTRVWPHQSFRVETMSTFDGLRWHYTPIPREFTIDHDTIFLLDGGVGSINDFIGFTPDSVVGQVFNVIVEGGRAAFVIEMPFTEPFPSLPNAPGHLTLRGTIWDADGDSLDLRDVSVLNPRTGAWVPISLVDASGTVAIQENPIIIDRDRMVSANHLRAGQQIRVLTNTPLNTVTIGSGLEAEGFIIIVEN
ncbi:MAG: S-layer homology domain-containing protein [Defluviitaleaceae bacterium]|nr:S-layer homology domain-containing protein [Defluviitaleaceae bacterium]MCL2274959.1 S-layer homology domain-containing protein [Defluviitaleaceae bacterium]